MFCTGLPGLSSVTELLDQSDRKFPKPFAVSKFEVTFDEWDTCIRYGDCAQSISDRGFGRGKQPVINATWDDAQAYVKWLAKMTGKPYRLLTEAEFEYAARGGTQTAYPWGDDVGKNNANYKSDRPAQVGSFPANAFGLYDMVNNVWQWVEDCYQDGYEVEGQQGKVDAPGDGSAWTSGDCRRRAARGAGWDNVPEFLRSAHRGSDAPAVQFSDLGFRVGRTLLAP
jgi:formylglycine-generating enzyme required for sulfatase activity